MQNTTACPFCSSYHPGLEVLVKVVLVCILFPISLVWLICGGCKK